MLDWTNFSKRFAGFEQKAFQNLAYFLFCLETEQKYGVFEYKDQWGIETEPVKYQGKMVGFQAKYYTTKISENKKDIKDSIADALTKNKDLNRIYLYLNDSFKESSLDVEKKPLFQKDIENFAITKGVKLVWRVPSNIDFMLALPERKFVKDYFFGNLDSPEIIVKRFNTFNGDLVDYPSKTNNKEYKRQQQKELEKFVDSNDEDNIALLAGDAGTGKSVLTKQLLVWQNERSIPTLAIKADYNQFSSIGELEKILGLSLSLEETIKYLIQVYGKMVVIIDQIDALSLTLSKDRHDLELYKHLINILASIKGLRIIISCREYDLNYDTFLQPLTKHHKIRIGQLENEQVKEIVEAKGVKYEYLNQFTKDLLRVSLHLSIFCDVYTVKQDANFTTINDLYERLWDKYISAKHSKIKTSELQNALKDISYRMYDRQELTIESKRFEDNHGQALAHLESSGLIKKAGEKKIQFFHQSFFDYAYARSYVNDGRHLYEDIVEQHQGFFTRARVKQVLDYLRSADVDEYKINVKHILTGGNYKTHIKFLVLNALTFQPNPSEDEKRVFDKVIKPNRLFYSNFIDYVWSGPWLDYLIDKGYIKEMFDSKDEELIAKLSSVAYRRAENYEPIVKMLYVVKDSDYQYKYKFISDILTCVAQLNIEEYNKCFVETCDKWKREKLYHYLGGVLEKNPALVVEVLKKQTEEYYNNLKKDELHIEYVPYRNSFYDIAREMSKQHKCEWTKFLMWFIKYVANATIMLVRDEKEMRESLALYLYSPSRPYSSADDIDAYYDEFIEGLKDIVKSNPKKIENYLLQCRESHIGCLVALAAICYEQNAAFFIDDIKSLLVDGRNYDGSTWLTYNMANLLNVSFEMLDSLTQELICDILYNLHPSWETLVIKDKGRIYHSKAFGETAFKYMMMIPKEYIKRSKLKQLYVEYEHKFGNIKNEPPGGVKTHVGWTSLPQSAYDNMSMKDWKHSFTEIISDQNFHDWDKPTLTGHAMAFGKCVEKDWHKFDELISEISCGSQYAIIYSVYACEGLCKAKADVRFVVRIAENIIHRTEKFEDRLISFLNSIEYIVDNGGLTDTIFDYIFELAYNKSSEYPNEDNQFNTTESIESFSYGKRGLAATEVIMCYEYKHYSDKIFEAMFKIAEDGNMATRVAVIFRMAYLQNIDTKRNIKLFFALQSLSMPKLASIPISNSNPLLYMITSDFKALIPYFETYMNLNLAGGQLKTILLIAWLRGYDGAEKLLKQAMAVNFHGIKEVYRQAVECLKVPKMKLKSFQFIMSCLDYDDKEFGRIADIYIDKIVKCLENDKSLVDTFIDKFIGSKLSRYQCRTLYEYLKEKAGEEPELTLQRLRKLQINISEEEDSYSREDNIFEIIVRAYNSIYKFDKEDSLLDFAINLFDRLLEKGKLGYRAFRFLNDLEK